MIALLVFLFNSPSLDCTRDRFYTLRNFFLSFRFFFTLSLSSFVVLRHSDDGEIDVKSIREFESESLRADAEKRREANRVLSEAEKRKKSAHRLS